MPMGPADMKAAVTRNLPAKTGKTLEQWMEVVRAYGDLRFKEKVERLKREHGLGHSTAAIIVDSTTDVDTGYVKPSPEQMVDDQYRGAKAALRPIYDRVIAAVRNLGADAKCEPRLTYVSLARRAQFGVVQASAKDRVDLGLRLPGIEASARLQAAGSFGSGNVTHRVALRAPEDVDDEVARWLAAAYAGRG